MTAQNPIQSLVASLARLPGIGEKTATRLALFLVNCPEDHARELARSIINAREKICFCSQCFNYTEQELCSICANPGRDGHVVCVVETPGDLMSIERTASFKGRYHVLHGVISPLDGIGPDQLRIRELVDRIREQQIHEVIIATNPTMNGNATAMYIADRLKHSGATVYRIAQGVPSGSDIGYADQVTLRCALDGRREMK
ncbi:MAG: recombination protein RecR [Deltaproteobacteria bacterium]|nr:recombination protein RecR [Deltaproteobacteria bacterium]